MVGTMRDFFQNHQDFKLKGDQVPQPALAIFQTSCDVRNKENVWNMASFQRPYSGYQKMMFGIWTMKTGHIPDIVHIPDIA